jgi:hypothetical protein
MFEPENQPPFAFKKDDSTRAEEAIKSFGAASGIIITIDPDPKDEDNIKTNIYGYTGETMRRHLPKILAFYALEIAKQFPEEYPDAQEEEKEGRQEGEV